MSHLDAKLENVVSSPSGVWAKPLQPTKDLVHYVSQKSLLMVAHFVDFLKHKSVNRYANINYTVHTDISQYM